MSVAGDDTKLAVPAVPVVPVGFCVAIVKPDANLMSNCGLAAVLLGPAVTGTLPFKAGIAFSAVRTVAGVALEATIGAVVRPLAVSVKVPVLALPRFVMVTRVV